MHDKKYMGFPRVLLALLVLAFMAGTASAAKVVYLVADDTTLALPDGRSVTVWGFCEETDDDFDVIDCIPSVPGPLLRLDPSDTGLEIRLWNNLTEPVSLHILGQRLTNNAGPVWTDGLTAQTVDDPRGAGNYTARVRSFTHETAPLTEALYQWNAFRAGTYLLQSGTNPAKQVQMGLFAPVIKDAAAGEAYSGVAYDNEVILVFHEIAADIHDAVSAGDYGPGKGTESSVLREAGYYLINGMAYADPGLDPLAPVDAVNNPLAAEEKVLLRFINGGLETHVPQVPGLYMKLVAEDGNKYAYPRWQHGMELPPGKTTDAMITPAAGGYALYDARLNFSNSGGASGGMLGYLNVGTDAVEIEELSWTDATHLKVKAISDATNPAPDSLTAMLIYEGSALKIGELPRKQNGSYVWIAGLADEGAPDSIRVVSPSGGSSSKVVPAPPAP